MLVIEQMQRWRCPTYNPRTTVIAPYASTEVVAALPDARKEQLLFFRCALPECGAELAMRRFTGLARAEGTTPAAMHAHSPECASLRPMS